MLDLEAIARRTHNLRTFNTDEKLMVDSAREDIKALLLEVQALRTKVEIYTKHARMDARKATRC